MPGTGGGYRTGKMRSVNPAHFSMVPRPDVPRSAFDVSHGHKTTFGGGALVPVYVEEVLPGDSIRVKMTAFCRLATPIVPVMDNIYLESFFFFVPNRLVWDNWERFMGETTGPSDTTTFLTPQVVIDLEDTELGKIADYFGITLNGTVGESINVLAFPFRAYNLIFNEWFRDQHVTALLDVNNASDGPDDAADYQLRARGKRADYFTTALPWPEGRLNIAAMSGMATFPAGYFPGGNMAFTQPIGAPVTGLGVSSGAVAEVGSVDIMMTGSRVGASNPHWRSNADDFFMASNTAGTAPNVRVLVNDMRTAIMVQALLEKSARGGSRYTEYVRAQFGVISDDARLQRPELLGMGRTPVQMHPVAQTAPASGESTKLAELSAVATAVAVNHGFSHSFREHGFIIGLICARADLTYQNGINRMWFRRTQFDFYVPALAHLGEQAIFKKELYANGTAEDDEVFGYQERWAEYKYKPSRISGSFRSQVTGAGATTLEVWHLAQDFEEHPSISELFMYEVPPFARVLQVDTVANEEFLIDMLFDQRMVRAMPMYSIPGIGRTL